MAKRHLYDRAAGWVVRHEKGLFVAGGILVVAVVAGQLLYPQNSALPLARMNGQWVALQTRTQLAGKVQTYFETAKVTLRAGDKSATTPLSYLGATANVDVLTGRLTDYPLWQRLIPGSIALKLTDVRTIDVYFATDKLKEASEALAKQLSHQSENARLAIQEGKLMATPAKLGYEVTSQAVLAFLSNAQFAMGTSELTMSAKKLVAGRSSSDIAPVRTQAEAAIGRKITIAGPDNQQFTPDSATIASWLVITETPAGKLELGIDDGKIAAYVATINDRLKVDAGTTNVEIRDGQEVGRTVGADGRSVASDELVAALKKAVMEGGEAKLTARMVATAPTVLYSTGYSATQQGLQAYVDFLARTKNMHIKIQQLDGAGWAASARADESIPSASTYKLFVALVLFDKMDKGEIHWEDPMLDTTVAGCFERMTVASTNPCAESWIAQFGRQYINDFIYARGFSSGTSFTTGSANQTTATDLSKFMTGLNNGTLVGGAYRDRLLDSLGRHPYRYGIPTGSQGVVHDKVGFLWDYVHDTAIVQHPRGTYIMTIMTKGQSYAAIASATREIERLMYP